MKKIVTLLFLFAFSHRLFCQDMGMAVQESIPKLNSYHDPLFKGKDTTAVIYLDFDGHYIDSLSRWAVYHEDKAFYAKPSGLNTTAIVQAWNIVKEDYAPFKVNITTDSMAFERAPYNKRIRVVITQSSDWISYAGGVAYIGSFEYGDDTPCWVFPSGLANSGKYVGDACSHEAGHTLGLTHHGVYNSDCSWRDTYNYGGGSGETYWAPIMGASYYATLGTWDNDAVNAATCPGTIQQDVELITAGFGVKKDDFSDTDGNAAPISLSADSGKIAFEEYGMITTKTDTDIFKFTLPVKSKLKLHVGGIWSNNALAANNLDVKIDIWQEGKKDKRKKYAPFTLVDINIDSVFEAGTYYVAVSGDGNAEMTNYGSLGNYVITGTGDISSLLVNIGRDSTICKGEQYTLDAKNPGAAYKWSTGDTTQAIVVKTAGTYSVVVTNYGKQARDTVKIGFRDAVKAGFSYSVIPSCEPVTLSVHDKTVFNCGEIRKLKWAFGDGETVEENNPVFSGERTHEYKKGGKYTIVYTLTDKYNNDYVQTQEVNVLPLKAAAHILGNDMVVCEGLPVNLDLTSMARPSKDYSWSTGESGAKITVTKAGKYSVNVIQEGNCVAADTIDIKWKNPLVADFVLLGTNNRNSSFADRSTSCSQAPNKWTWEFGDGSTSALQNPKHRYAKIGRYTVTLTVKNDYGTNKLTKDVFVSGVYYMLNDQQSVRNGEDPIVYNNTISGNEIILQSSEKASYRLMSVNGQLLGKGRLSQGTNHLFAMNIPKGMFFIYVKGKTNHLIKLIKL